METNMQTYTLPRETFNLLVEALGNQQKAETFAKSMESFLVAINNSASAGITEKKELLKVEVREELRKELVTREMFEGLGKEMRENFKVVYEKFSVVDEKFKLINDQFKLVNDQFKLINDQFKLVDERFKGLEEGMADKFKMVDERFKGLEDRVDVRCKSLEDRMDEKFKGLNIKLNLFLAIALIALTFANPVFVELIRKVF